jgi:hypothetical protein
VTHLLEQKRISRTEIERLRRILDADDLPPEDRA